MLAKKIEDFKPITLTNTEEEESYFDVLYGVLKKINKTGQKSSNTLSMLKDEIVEEVQKTYQNVEEIREERIKVIRDNERLEKGVIEYNDILNNIERAAQFTKLPDLVEMTSIAIKAVEQINAKLGIIEIPAEPFSTPDAEYHMIINTEITENESADGKIATVDKKGYRRGDKLLRLASVIVFKWEGKKDE
ncbi:MAG: nucleotide exchange factor GrpE [Candidatus Marinimicrobia bacterium]|nr:nucleotide exchange factor GrpE [Candidatus Neomarinimicrobiota bacterium]MBT4993341.1 nucleotide exchange factor GrpE [Candidatus Neomarinimicrobiota bacterium]